MVGKGAFGKVRIVERKDTGLTFALKYIRKDESAYFSPMAGEQEGRMARRASDAAANMPSRTIRERAEYHKGAADVGALEPPLHLQPAI